MLGDLLPTSLVGCVICYTNRRGTKRDSIKTEEPVAQIPFGLTLQSFNER